MSASQLGRAGAGQTNFFFFSNLPEKTTFPELFFFGKDSKRILNDSIVFICSRLLYLPKDYKGTKGHY